MARQREVPQFMPDAESLTREIGRQIDQDGADVPLGPGDEGSLESRKSLLADLADIERESKL